MTEQPGIRAHRIGPTREQQRWRYTYNLSVLDDFLSPSYEELHEIIYIFCLTRNLPIHIDYLRVSTLGA